MNRRLTQQQQHTPHTPMRKAPWWSQLTAAVIAALIMAGMVSLGASMISSAGAPQNPEDRLERMLEARMSGYLADATEHMDP